MEAELLMTWIDNCSLHLVKSILRMEFSMSMNMSFSEMIQKIRQHLNIKCLQTQPSNLVNIMNTLLPSLKMTHHKFSDSTPTPILLSE